jgi:hypothetical protein
MTRHPLLRRTIAAVLTASALVALSAPVAQAGEQTVVGGTTRGGGSTSGSGGATVCTATNAGRNNGVIIYLPVYPECVSSGYRKGRNYEAGPLGFEVWRFYGEDKAGGRAKAYTVSRANAPQWGRENLPYSLYAPHPADAKASWKTSFGPWHVSDQAVQANGKAYMYGNRSASGNLKSAGRAVKAASGNWTTDAPFVYSSNSCKDLQGDDAAIRRAFDRSRSDYNSEESKSVRVAMFDSFKSARAHSGTRLGLSLINARGSVSKGDGQAPTSPEDIKYNDGLACSSVFDFLREQPAKPVQFATCWMPIEARFIRFTHPSMPWLGGFTSSTQPAYDTTRLSAKSRTDTRDPHHEYRQAIYKEVYARSNDGVSTPTQPYPASLMPTGGRDRAKSADTAASYANCITGFGALQNVQAGGEVSNASDHVVIGIDGPRNYVHRGGRLTSESAKFTATYQGLRCKGGPCTWNGQVPPAEVVSVDYKLSVQGMGGYARCARAGQLNCDFDLEQAASPTSSYGKGATGQKILTASRHDAKLFLLNGMSPSQHLAIGVSGTTGPRAVATVREFHLVVPQMHTFCQISTSFGGTGETRSSNCPPPPPPTLKSFIRTDVPVKVVGARQVRTTNIVGRR